MKVLHVLLFLSHGEFASRAEGSFFFMSMEVHSAVFFLSDMGSMRQNDS